MAGGSRNEQSSKAIICDVSLFFESTTSTSYNSDIDELFNKKIWRSFSNTSQ